ncbi:MAG: 3-deoxy-manno-octulosonate cytidylyltransferase, partial [Candidatus Omnitrophica bacterium]|nr:3-deoxy-manno-octulosonate cytidylyltransferase [Candidatus Omnitrophota bacterium]
MKVLGVIPARYGAARFPGKPLAPINGEPLIHHVWRRAGLSKRLDALLIATDDRRILEAAKRFGAQAVMTPLELPSGTDRVW